MKSTIVVGLQWGDEGKGKIIDAMARRYEYVVRWNGGNNAGHTVVVSRNKYPLSLIPSGVLQRKRLLIAQGVVINPKVLLAEIAMLESHGFRVKLTIDPRCHIVMPYHQLMDAANEKWKGKYATGSLHLGIGYCYEDRNNRHGIRMEDLIRPKIFTEKVRRIFPLKKAIIEKAYGMPTTLSLKEILRTYIAYGKKLAPYVGDVSVLVSRHIAKHAFLFEQAHGTMLDPVFGTYPYTVAPPTIAGAMYPAVGIPSMGLPVLGIAKAYTTRVGNGPHPTELTDAAGKHMQQVGGEIGTVSKRVRRCGWLDLVQLRYAVRINGVTSLAITKLDVLSGLSKLKICTGYRIGKTIFHEFPAEINDLPHCHPVYDTLSGWQKSLSGIRSFRALPKEAKMYLLFVKQQLGIPINMISVGPDRKELISV